MKFQSKKDWWISLIVWVPVAIVWGQIFLNFEWLIVVGNLLLTAFISVLWFGTYYVIDQETLTVAIGLLSKKIPIERITSMRASRSIVSSAALSLDRVEINYRETDIFPDVVYVSPKDKMRFVVLLQERNPKIELDEKLATLVEETKVI